ncbi:pyrimidine-nucleoside phosphorylase [Pseudobacteroides cellulosolvens]|uniref:Pyrimidine-nucleoside phosphorylase n=1 Tax=Pseudobacteroides cellulosolvens ATCC 35603 = DSM 2933 TaxID=398512 RepID=A0A0L6JHS6_9FIRM|nr:pyrimidine-nucleoside phosphorylase [Pseudobacteroides cellulosolvens]KNY25042.1 pyrimidine-nucleoside phosphorylase [Pseudobacteroides cellulosolvens ATCC 35603 = DSM 2933]
MRMYDIIEKKRDGHELIIDEIKFFIDGYCSGNIPDYQASALLMAIFIRGLNKRETADLTNIMADSGDKVDLSSISGVKVDKHSTGGVGDKTTLVVAPVAAACGVPVAKMSGKGLGHTGGTIDKLESIPGFRTSLGIDEFLANVREIGLSIASQTGNLAPADKKLYALRDVTATVNNISLIASSIMSKKIASGADSIVLDVKTGSGAFMKTFEDSVALAKTMIDIGESLGRRTSALITDMDLPLGNAVGNSMEVIEAIDTLKGKGPSDLRKLSVELAARMLQGAGKGSYDRCVEMAEKSIIDGSALKKLTELIERQNGNTNVIDDYSIFGESKHVYEYKANCDGYIASIRTDSLGIASMILGAGRENKDSIIDYSAGIMLEKKTYDKVSKGDVVARFYTNNKKSIDNAAQILDSSITISNDNLQMRPLILAYIDSSGVNKYIP